MIPKGLLIAVATGVAAGAIAGVYLQNLNSQNIVSVDGSSISIHVEKQDYELGQTVAIQIINSGTTKLRFSDEIPSIRVRALDGTVFFSTSFDGVKLLPGQKYSFEWNQQKNDNSKIIEGRYVVESFAYDQNNQKVSDSTTLNVLR
ncbi:MAG: hypothetical protein WAO91_01340 [Candidatus Nitrosotenuis sp.]